MTIHKLLWTQPAVEVLVLIRDYIEHPPECVCRRPAQDPFLWNQQTQLLPEYELRTER